MNTMIGHVLGMVLLLAVGADAGGGCETAWARHEDEVSRTCFIELGLGNWGWTNYITGTVTLPVYSAAGRCNINSGFHSADLEISYEPGTGVRLTWVPLPGVTITEYQLYLGSDKLPTKPNGKYTAAPGSLGVVNGDASPLWHLFSMAGVAHGDGFYIAAHAVTCGTPTHTVETPAPTPAPTDATPAPTPAPTDATPAPTSTPAGPKVEIGGVVTNEVALGGSETYDDGRVELSSIPEFIRDMVVHAPTSDVAGDTTIELTCGDEACGFVISHYHCPPCSGAVNGGFPAILPHAGFVSAGTAPRWGGTEEKMVSYGKELGPGESIQVTTAVPATSFVVFSQVGSLGIRPTPPAPWTGPSVPQRCTCV